MRTTIAELLQLARAGLDRLEPHEAYARSARGDAVLVDVRSAEQRARDGELPGAVRHPRNVLEWRCDPTCSHHDPRLSGDLEATLVVVCDEGYQSSLAAHTLQLLGFARATDLAGGFQAWRAAGLPVERAAQDGGSDQLATSTATSSRSSAVPGSSASSWSTAAAGGSGSPVATVASRASPASMTSSGRSTSPSV